MKTFKEITLAERTEIGQYYKDGLTASAIAPLYGTDKKTINNVVSFLRNHGVIIPFKVKPRSIKPKELLVIPEESKTSSVKPKRKYTARKPAKKVTKKSLVASTPVKRKGVESDNVGFFVLGALATSFVLYVL